MKLNVLLSNGKGKLDLFLSEYKRNRELERSMDSYNKGDLGRIIAYIVLILAGLWFVIRLFS